MCERMRYKVHRLFLWRKGKNHGHILDWPCSTYINYEEYLFKPLGIHGFVFRPFFMNHYSGNQVLYIEHASILMKYSNKSYSKAFKKNLFWIQFILKKSVSCEQRWAKRSELAGELLSTVIGDFQTTRYLGSHWFFDMVCRTKNVSFWPHFRYPWWTCPAQPDPARP